MNVSKGEPEDVKDVLGDVSDEVLKDVCDEVLGAVGVINTPGADKDAACTLLRVLRWGRDGWGLEGKLSGNGPVGRGWGRISPCRRWPITMA